MINATLKTFYDSAEAYRNGKHTHLTIIFTIGKLCGNWRSGQGFERTEKEKEYDVEDTATELIALFDSPMHNLEDEIADTADGEDWRGCTEQSLREGIEDDNSENEAKLLTLLGEDPKHWH